MHNSNAQIQATGRRAVYADTLLWSLFPIITASSVGHVSPLSALALSGCVLAIALTLYTMYAHHVGELTHLTAWKYATLSSICIDVIYYSCIFIGLTYTTPGNAAMIGLCEILTTYFLFNILQKQRIPQIHKIGVFVTLSGASLILLQGFSGINWGDILIAISICFAPVGNFFQKKAGEFAHPTSVILMRALVALPIITTAALLFEPASIHFTPTIIGFLLFNGILLAVSRVLWLISITDLPPIEASALSCIGTACTLFLAWIVYGTTPTGLQIAALPLICIGVLLLSRTTHRHRRTR
ncbi:MAG: hypothetical protein RI911_886 [Candidatus Parcubacteria bacterium]|jgi:drug/metabolite transporter (DMT)-like permease